MLPASRQFGLRVALFYAGFFCISGIVTPFLPVWLKARGLSSEEIAVCLAFPLGARLLMMPIGSWLADRLPSRRLAIKIFCIGALALFIPASLVHGYLPIMVLTGLMTTVAGLVAPAIDALALSGVRRFGLDYGSMRVWGSINFIVISSLAGIVVGRFGNESLTPMLIAAYFGALAAAFALPAERRPVSPKVERFSRKSALVSRNFLIIIAGTSLTQASHAMLYTFGTIYWEQRGFTGSEIGLLWSIGVLAEVVMFAFSGRILRHIGAEALITIGCAGAIIRWLLFPYADHFATALVLQTFHALTFAAVFAGMQVAIAREIPDEMTASAQGISQIVSGILLAGGTLLAGPLYARFDGTGFQMMAVFGLLAILVLRLPRESSAPKRP